MLIGDIMKKLIFFLAIMVAFAFSSVSATQYDGDGIYAHYGTVDVASFDTVDSVLADNPISLETDKIKYDLAKVTDNQMFMYALHSFSAGKYEVGWQSFSF